jgi:hypothetical protein
MTKISREASIDLSEYFCRFGFGDGDDALAVAVGKEWRDAVIDWINEGLGAEGLELEAARDEALSMHNDCMIVLQETRDENGERLRADERDDLDLSAQDMSELLDMAEAVDPKLRGVLDAVNGRLEEAAGEDPPRRAIASSLVFRLVDRIERIAALASGEEPRAKDKILAICEETLALIREKEGS